MNQAFLIPLVSHVDNNGYLAVFEEGAVPIPVVRTFVVHANAGQTRGEHAHLSCTQVLAVLQGKVKVTVDNGTTIREFILEALNHGLVIPPGLWATQLYLEDGSILLVSCDRLFDEADYVRDAEQFAAMTSRESLR